jgi:hypothetical protein
MLTGNLSELSGPDVRNVWAASSGTGEKRVCPSGNLGVHPSASSPAAIHFAVARKSPYGVFNLILDRAEGQAREWVCAILLSFARQRLSAGSTWKGNTQS